VLLAAEGWANRRIAHQLETSRPTVILWRNRFAAGGPMALTEHQPGRGRRPRVSPDRVKKIVEAKLHGHPTNATHWSVRTMAAAQGVSPAPVQRIWDAHGLQPHRTETFKLSRDKRFGRKLTDVVGLYRNPPERALVLCFDEKSQIPALDRTQPGLPMKRGRCGTASACRDTDTRNSLSFFVSSIERHPSSVPCISSWIITPPQNTMQSGDG